MTRSTAIGIAALLAATFCVSATADIPEDPLKWAQWPDIDTGADMQSEWNPLNQDPGDGTYDPDVIKADDWICNGFPLTGIHWWGSYINNETTTITGFWIHIYDNDEVGPGIADDKPGTLLQSWLVYFADTNETFYADDQNPTTHPPPDDLEHVYLYSYDLPEDEWFDRQEGEKSWLSIVAETPDVFGDAPMWGWHTGLAPAGPVTTGAVTGKVKAYSPCPEGDPLDWAHMPHNMAFVLTTVPEPATCTVIGIGALGLAALRRRRRR